MNLQYVISKKGVYSYTNLYLWEGGSSKNLYFNLRVDSIGGRGDSIGKSYYGIFEQMDCC